MSLIVLSMIVSFAIIYFAVRLAISPLLSKLDERDTNNLNYGIEKLRDIGVLSAIELSEVIELFYKREKQKEGNEQYQKFMKVMNELKEMDYFIDDEWNSRVNKLKAYYKID